MRAGTSMFMSLMGPKSRWAVCACSVLACYAVSADASLEPGKWTTQRIIGVKGGAWIAIHVERHHTSYYRYQTKSELRATRTVDGCVLKRRRLGNVVHQDGTTYGNWKRKVLQARQSSPFALMQDAIAVLPVNGREFLSVRADAVVFKEGDISRELVSAGQTARWAKLAGIELRDDLRIAELLAPADDISNPGPVYLILETPHRDLDADYARFVVPLNISAFRKLLDDGITDAARLAASQPQPTGC